MPALRFGGLKIEQRKDYFLSNWDNGREKWTYPVQLWAVDTPEAILFIYKHSEYAKKVLRIETTKESLYSLANKDWLDLGGTHIDTDGTRFTLTATSIGAPRAEAEIDRADVPGTLVFLYNNCWQAQRVLQLEEIGEFDHGEQTK